MKDSIELSPKHGVNPTIPICAWCGEPKNEIAMLGHIGDLRKGEDFEAPKNAVLNYEPCEHCKEKWEQGIPFIEAQPDTPVLKNQPPLQDNIYPTGRLIIATIEGAQKIGKYFKEPPEFKKGSPICLDKEAFEMFFGGLEFKKEVDKEK